MKIWKEDNSGYQRFFKLNRLNHLKRASYFYRFRLVCLIFFGISFAVACLFWSCAPTPSSAPPVAMEPGPGDDLFLEAEKLFELGQYDQALETYQAYITRFSDRPLVGAALMKIGSIFNTRQDFEAARNTFQRIVSDYPESPFLLDAKLEIIATYYQEGNFNEVIQHATKMVKATDSKNHLLRLYALLGDTYMAVGSAPDAVYAFSAARSLTEDSGKESIEQKLREAVAQLSADDIRELLAQAKEPIPRDWLMFRLGVSLFQQDRFEEAVEILSQFISTYPMSENAVQATNMINEFNEKSMFMPNTIGCLLPLTGPYEKYGNRALKGIEMALARFSERTDRPPINIIIKDTGANANQTTRAALELSEEQVAAIIGPIIMAEPAALVAQEKWIPMITLSQKDNVTLIGDYVFRNFLTPQMQVKTLVDYAAEKLGLNRYAILYPNEKYGTTFMNLFWDEVIEHNGTIVGVEVYDPKQTDFADSIKKLVGLYYEIPDDLKEKEESVSEEEQDEDEEPEPTIDFDAIFIPDSPTKAGLIIPQLAFHDVVDVYLFGTNLWHSETLIRMAKEYVQGAIMTDGFWVDNPSENVRNFVVAFEETYGEKPGFIEAIAYDSAFILFETVTQPEMNLKSDMKDTLLNDMLFDGVTGLTSFDDAGEAEKNLFLTQIQGSRFVGLNN